MWARIIVLHLSFKLEVEDWQLTHWDLLPQYFPTLLAHSLKLKTFSTMKHLFVFCLMCSCFFDAAQTLLRSNYGNRHKPVIVFPRVHHFLKKNLEVPLKSCQMWKAIWMKTMKNSNWLRKAFTLSLIGYTSTCENSCTPFWLAV